MDKIKTFFRGKKAPKTAMPTSEPRAGVVTLIDGRGGTPMGVSTVYRCVGLLSDSVANLPVVYKKLRGGLYEPDEGSRLWYLLNVEPDTAYNAFDFWKQTVMEVLLTGNAYIIPVADPVSGEWQRLALCTRGSVSHDTTTDTYTVSDFRNGIFGKYDESGVIHIKGMTGAADPKTGLSVIGYARMTLDIAQTGDRETLQQMENGGDVRGILGNDTSVRGYGEYQDKELKKLALDVDTRFRTGERVVSLPGDVRWQPLSMSSADMQFLESRKFTVREICRFFGVHPSFVFDDTSNNYKSAEMANVAFLSNTLNPLLRRIELELQRKLFGGSRKRKIEFDRRALYACDLESKVSYQSKMIAAGLLTVNEARLGEDRPPVEGGDTPLVSANLVTLGGK